MQKHGLRYHPLYGLWCGIKRRCYNSHEKCYKNYGGRGIKVCEEWKDNPKRFIEWALANGWEKGLQLDRINNNSNYAPDNCRFVTNRENSLNTDRLQSNNKTGYVGVSFHSRDLKYIAYIRIYDKLHALGYYKTKVAAVMARNKYIIDHSLEKEYPIQSIIPQQNH